MTTTLTDERYQVLDFLKKELKVIEGSGLIRMFYNVGAKDLVKYLEHPEKCGTWPFNFVCMAEDAVNKIAKKYLIPFPIIENQAEEDRVLAKFLYKNTDFYFDSKVFFRGSVTVKHVIQYMERQDAIYEWTAIFVLQVKEETKKVKEFLL